MVSFAEQFGEHVAEFKASRPAQFARHERVAPSIATVVNALVPAPGHEARLEFYRRALARHDWWFQYADDYTVFKAGERNAVYIHAERCVLDPDFSVWNDHAPEEFRVAVKVAA